MRYVPPIPHNYDKQCRCLDCQNYEFQIQDMVEREKREPHYPEVRWSPRGAWGSGYLNPPRIGPRDNR